MPRINADFKNNHIISAGTSGSGKTWFVKNQLARLQPTRLLIFDPSDEYGDIDRVVKYIDAIDLTLALIANTTGKFRFVSSGKDDYRIFCKLAKAWGNADWGELIVVIEEATSVSSAGKSTEGELELITQGRKYGITICYIIHSLAEGSKTALKNISTLRIGMCDEMDVKYLEQRFGKELGEAVRDLSQKEAVIFNKETKKFTKSKAT